MIFRLFSIILLIAFALIGTATGSALRMLFDKPYRKRHRTPDTDDLIITAVISNSLIAAAIALFSGARFITAFVGGAVLTVILGDRLDREPFGETLSLEEEDKELVIK